jgi:hypothetical protein
LAHFKALGGVVWCEWGVGWLLFVLAQYGVNIKALILGFFALCSVVVALVGGVVAWRGVGVCLWLYVLHL